ncbi:dna-(apurinic or apyrimidinic site) lyase [Moniliophthora roreri MCA 2997]|uniref:Endonuclease III homolog n=1 Tax=Moniliophthora roreri (strain MCA 2997) TaxID=1381753 RepID=V2WEF0_MONRO|nr:dna-(apurinic or apyrimidinic site) lyase [Moniliophthora roreri MCA 2997]
MSNVKRTVTTRSTTRLAAKASPFHSAVTLFEIDSAASSSSTVTRPAKRSRISKEENQDIEGPLTDIESSYSSASEDAPKRKRKTNPTPKSPSKSPRKPKPIPQSLATPHPAPENWRQVYDKIKEMRKGIVAPVDTMGCDQAQLKEVDPKNRRFSTLVSLMLSSQTKDEVTDAAVSQLRTALGGSISVEGVIAADEATVSNAIGKVGFWRRKTQYLKQAAVRLRDEFDSDVPKTVDELCSLPGVGPKMAFLALQVAWNLNHGIGVDVHVHRITNRLGWHKPPTKNPEETRLNLQSWLPTEFHPEINHMLVGFGQTVCLPVRPRCDQCVLSTDGLCPSAQLPKTKKAKKVKTEVKTEDDGGPKITISLEEQYEVMKEEEEPMKLKEEAEF